MTTIIFSNIYSERDYSKIAVVRGIMEISEQLKLKLFIDVPKNHMKRKAILTKAGFSLIEVYRKVQILKLNPDITIFYRPQRLDNLLVLLYVKLFKRCISKIILWENYGFRGVKSSQKSLLHKSLIAIDILGVKLATILCDEILVNNVGYKDFVKEHISNKMKLFPNPVPLIRIDRSREVKYSWGLINVGKQDFKDYTPVFNYFKEGNYFGCIIGGEVFSLSCIDSYKGLPIEEYFRLLSAIDVLVIAFPSTERNDCRFPNKLIDAIFYGRKILCSSNPFLKSLFADYKNIYWYSDDDFEHKFKFVKDTKFDKQAQEDFVKYYRGQTSELIVQRLT